MHTYSRLKKFLFNATNREKEREREKAADETLNWVTLVVSHSLTPHFTLPPPLPSLKASQSMSLMGKSHPQFNICSQFFFPLENLHKDVFLMRNGFHLLLTMSLLLLLVLGSLFSVPLFAFLCVIVVHKAIIKNQFIYNR